MAARAAISAQVVAWLSGAPPAPGGDCGWADAAPWGVAVNAGLACVTVAAAAVMLRLATRRQGAGAAAGEAPVAAPALEELHAPLLGADEAADALQDAAP